VIKIIHTGSDNITLEWISDPVSDMIADSVVALVSQLEVSPSKGTH
jgi:hypothetical protein